MNIKEMAATLNSTTSSIVQLKRKAENLQKQITKAERVRVDLLKQLRSPEAYEAWLATEQIAHVRMDASVDGRRVSWWVVKVDSETATLVLYDAGMMEDPHCPCLCCHESMGFSPYEVDQVSEAETYRHTSKGFRKEWADWFVAACKTLQCGRLEVYGADNAQKAQSVTPLPLEWASYRDYEGLEQLALPPWLCLHKSKRHVYDRST